MFNSATDTDSYTADDSIANVQLDSLIRVATIGVGGFGRVELVGCFCYYSTMKI